MRRNDLVRMLVLAFAAVCSCGIARPIAAAEVLEEPAQAASLDRAEAERLFTHAGEVFEQGLEKAKTDYTGAESLFRETAAAWRRVAEGLDVQNARLETNIGNASLLGGDAPAAIIAYRRALELDPQAEGARDGLAAARRAAGTQTLAPGAPVGGDAQTSGAEAEGAGGVRGTVRQVGGVLAAGGEYVSRHLPSRMLLWVAGVSYVVFFALAMVRVVGSGKRVRPWMVGVVGGVCVLSATPLVLREMGGATAEGVVTQTGVVARNGPAELYDAAFKEPLRAGLEVRVEETRGSWAKVRIADGRSAWVPVESVRRI